MTTIKHFKGYSLSSDPRNLENEQLRLNRLLNILEDFRRQNKSGNTLDQQRAIAFGDAIKVLLYECEVVEDG